MKSAVKFTLFCFLCVLSHVFGQLCKSPYTQIANECYHFSSDAGTSWVEAREYCLRIGGLLAVLDTEEKNQAVGDYVYQSQVITRNLKWIALNDKGESGKYIWDGTGDSVTYNALADVTEDNCIVTGYQNGYKWTSRECDVDLPFICQQLPSCDCVSPFTTIGNGCYYITSLNMNWMDAHNYCNSLRSSLISIDSAEEQAAIDDSIIIGVKYWIGAYDAGHEGTWYFDNGGYPMNYTNWLPGQPQGEKVPVENCALTVSGTWQDYPCEDEFRFICEKPTKC